MACQRTQSPGSTGTPVEGDLSNKKTRKSNEESLNTPFINFIETILSFFPHQWPHHEFLNLWPGTSILQRQARSLDVDNRDFLIHIEAYETEGILPNKPKYKLWISALQKNNISILIMRGRKAVSLLPNQLRGRRQPKRYHL